MSNKTGRKWLLAVGYRKVTTTPDLGRLASMGVVSTQRMPDGTTRVALSYTGIVGEVERCRSMGLHGLADQLEEVFLQ